MSKRKNDKKLSTRQRALGIGRVAAITYKASPLAVLIKGIGALVTAILPIITTYFAALTTTALADAYTGVEGAGDRAIMYVIVTATLGIALTAWNSLENYLNEFVRYKINAAISDQMYEHFLALDFWRYDDKHTADLFDRSKQFANFFSSIFDSLSSIVTSFVAVIAGVVALAIVSWWLGLILVVAIVPGVIIQLQLSRKQIAHWNDNVETRRKKNIIEWDMLDIKRIAEFRLYGLARHLLNLRANLRDADEKQRIEFERTFIWRQLGADVLETAAEVIALLYITLQIIAHTQPVGQFLYVQQITSRALSGLRRLTSDLNRIDSDIANLFDYNEFMELPETSARPVALTAQPNTITLQDVSFQYPSGEQTVLQDVSLSISRGQHIALVGENGAGKSTLIKLLLGLYEPTHGAIMLDDTNLATVQVSSWHRYIGVLQQDFGVYSFATARDNILFGDLAVASPEQLDRAMREAEAKTFLEKLPKGVDSYIMQWMEHDDGTSGVDLSGGQRQRLALARNFYRDSPIIILDEPTSAIDALAESRIFKHLFAKQDKTIITVSHRLTTVQKADVIYVLKDGKIVEQGSHTELVAQKSEYYTIFESQL